MIKVIKKKNPSDKAEGERIAKSILKNYNALNMTYIDHGFHGYIYSFLIKDSSRLKPGKYIIKIFNEKLKPKDIKYLMSISNYGLIPKVYEAKENYYIMKFIDGKILDDIYHRYSDKQLKIFINEIIKIVKIWHKLGIYHGDINPRNVIITNTGKIILIDPILSEGVEDDCFIENLWNDLELGPYNN